MTQARTFSLGGSSRAGLLIAAILAAVTGVIVFLVLQDDGGGGTVRNTTGGTETNVVVAKQDIPARTEITRDMVELAKVPSNALLGGAFSDRSLVEGRVARIPIYRGEQMVSEKLASEKRDLGLAFIVPDGMRGIAIGVDKVVGAGGLIRPGDRVDIIGVIDIKYKDINTGKEFAETRAFTLAQNVEVLAVEDRLQNVVVRDGQSAGDGTTTDQPAPDREGKVVTLAIAPAAAQNLLLADAKGDLRLSVRAPGDTEIVDLPNSTFINLADPEFAKLLQEILARR